MSSTDVKIFEKEEFGSVRVVMQGDDPWFVASDVAKSLGYDNPANAINTHCKKINKITLSPDLGGREISSKMPPVVMNIIPESDVYRLVMRSNLPNAVAFQDWVCEEVLPAIRKTGEYSTTLPDFTNPAEADSDAPSTHLFPQLLHFILKAEFFFSAFGQLIFKFNTRHFRIA